MKMSYIRKNKVKETITGYLFILPNLIGFMVFVFGGLVFSLFMSFTDWNLLRDLDTLNFVGLKNYLELPGDKWFVDSLVNNIWFLTIVPLQIFISLILANILNADVFGRKTLRALYYIPYITNLVAVSVVWMTLYHPRFGPINQFLKALGVANPPLWLASVQWAKPAIALIIFWQQLGYHALLYLSALQAIPRELYEASHVDGATKFQQFFRITMPLVSPTTFLILVLSLISNFQSWSIVQVLTSGGPGTATHTLGFYIYNSAFKLFRMGYASAVSWVLFIIIFIITLIQWKGQKKWVNYL